MLCVDFIELKDRLVTSANSLTPETQDRGEAFVSYHFIQVFVAQEDVVLHLPVRQGSCGTDFYLTLDSQYSWTQG